MVGDQDQHRAHHCDQDAVKIHPGNAVRPEHRKDVSANDSADDSEDYIEKHAFACFVDKLAADESSDQSEHNPSQKRHIVFSFPLSTTTRSLSNKNIQEHFDSVIQVKTVDAAK